MTTTIGRATLTSAPYGVQHSGDRLSFSIDVVGYSLAVAKVKRQQLLGLVDNSDEPVIPFTSALDPDYDGFYRVAGVSVEPTIVYQLDGTMRCQVSLERVAVGGAMVELTGISEPLSGETATDVASGLGQLVAMPSAIAANEATSAVLVRATPDGNVRLVGETVPTFFIRDVASCLVQPSQWYVGAATIELESGGTWYPLSGNWTVPDPTDVRITNGVVRITFTTTTLTIERWTGSTWGTSHTFTLYTSDVTSANAAMTIRGARIIRNSPEVCVLRLDSTFNKDLGGGGPNMDIGINLDVHIERGDAGVWLRTSRDNNMRPSYGLVLDSAEPSTLHSDFGIYQTTPDSGSWRWAAWAPIRAAAPSAANSIIAADSVGTNSALYLGMSNESGVANLDTLAAMSGRALYVQSLTQRVVTS